MTERQCRSKTQMFQNHQPAVYHRNIKLSVSKVWCSNVLQTHQKTKSESKLKVKSPHCPIGPCSQTLRLCSHEREKWPSSDFWDKIIIFLVPSWQSQFMFYHMLYHTTHLIKKMGQINWTLAEPYHFRRPFLLSCLHCLHFKIHKINMSCMLQ